MRQRRPPSTGELNRLGCDPGEVDGAWGASSKDAAKRFKRFARLKSLDTDEPSQGLLDALRAKDGRVCPLECGRGFRAKGGVCIAIEREPKRRVREAEPERRRPVRRPVEARERPYYAPRRAEPPPAAPKQEAPYVCTIDLGYGRTAPCGGGR